MKKEDAEPLAGKNVKLVFISGFVIRGRIVKISDDAIFFRTKETISAVSLGNINSIVLRSKGDQR